MSFKDEVAKLRLKIYCLYQTTQLLYIIKQKKSTVFLIKNKNILFDFFVFCAIIGNNFGETGGNPVRARRRELLKAFIYPMPQIGDKPLRIS